MPPIEGIIYALIYICLLALVVYVVFWVLGIIGIAIPEQVTKIVWVIVALIALLILLRALLPGTFGKLALVSSAQASPGPIAAVVGFPPLCLIARAQRVNVTENRQLNPREVAGCFLFLIPQPAPPVYQPKRR